MTGSLDLTSAAGRRAWAKQLFGPIDDAKWDALAWELFAFQYARIPAFKRLCLGREMPPEKMRSWKDIPAIPQQLFKREKLFGHGTRKAGAIYETSGTTTGQPGRQHLLDTLIYNAVSIEGARRAGLLDPKTELHFLVSPPAEAPRSSLSAMFAFWQKALHQTGLRFWVRRDEFDFVRLREVLSLQIKARRPIGICGTAFSFVHLADAWADLPPLDLPRGSFLLETGGFKGRSRELSKPELYAKLAGIFSIPDTSIWNEYGMSELSSQAYARGTHGLHQTPPWARVLVVDPATGREVGVGQRGLVRWIDLANTDSVMAVQTLDLAERAAKGFRLMGRLPRTEPRGCSLSIDDLMQRKEAA